MKNIKDFKRFKNISEAAEGLDIKNEYSKLINDPKLGTIDLGLVVDISQTDITNIKQTYKDSIIQNVEGHYIMSLKKTNENYNKGKKYKVTVYVKTPYSTIVKADDENEAKEKALERDAPTYYVYRENIEDEWVTEPLEEFHNLGNNEPEIEEIDY